MLSSRPLGVEFNRQVMLAHRGLLSAQKRQPLDRDPLDLIEADLIA
jgi:hypothetical protein